MNIILIGMRGSGKTTVGRMLAERLGFAFADTDEMVTARVGKSIQDIVAQEGWGRFRDLETEAVRKVAEQDKCVIACGGGVIVRDGNVKALKRNGILVWLTAPVGVLAERVRNDTGSVRPALTEETDAEREIEKVFQEREPKYRTAAQLIISTNDKTPTGIVDEIIWQIEKL